MFKGLCSYEIILMIGGSSLFLILIFALIWDIIRNKSIVSLLPFFLLPIVMIGRAAITSVSYDNGNITIQKNAEKVIDNLSDTTAVQQLENTIASIDTARAANDPNALANISQAYYALGKYDSAALFNDKGLELNPSLPKAQELQKNIALQVNNIRQLQNNLTALKTSNNPASDNAIKTNIANLLQSTRQLVYVNKNSNLIIAKAHAEMGDSAKCISIVNNVLKRNPQSADALQLKQSITDKNFNSGKNDSLSKILS